MHFIIFYLLLGYSFVSNEQLIPEFFNQIILFFKFVVIPIKTLKLRTYILVFRLQFRSFLLAFVERLLAAAHPREVLFNGHLQGVVVSEVVVDLFAQLFVEQVPLSSSGVRRLTCAQPRAAGL